MYEVDQLVY